MTQTPQTTLSFNPNISIIIGAGNTYKISNKFYIKFNLIKNIFILPF